MKNKLGKLILDFLVKKKVKYVFILNGGAIAFLIDYFKDRKDIQYVCVNHEQAAAMMADAYSRVGPGFAATMVTSGPGATNLITGICCSWFDSISTMHICGQVNQSDLKRRGNNTINCRQIGFQETDIVSMTKGITKKSIQLNTSKNINKLLNNLYHLSTSDRGGPVLIDIPINFQKKDIEIDPIKSHPKKLYKKSYKINFNKFISLINNSVRPVFIIGAGIRLSKSERHFYKFIKKFDIPIVTTWGGFDILPFNFKNYFGNIGVYGQRAANLITQNSDLIITLGTRLDTRVTGSNLKTFAPKAKLLIVDVDKNELNKNRYSNKKFKIYSDLNYFFYKFNQGSFNSKKFLDWIKCCKKIENYMNTHVERKYKSKTTSPYNFFDLINKHSSKNAIFVLDTGAHLTWGMQTIKLKSNQRLISAFGNSPMGYALPASIGSYFANTSKQIICITGDGSLHINIQELHLVHKYNMNIKIFVLNNEGYGIIKQFQGLYLNGYYEGSEKGYTNPDILAIGKSYKIKTFVIKNNKSIETVLSKVMSYIGPAFINVIIDKNQTIEPKLEYGNSLDRLSPIISTKSYTDMMKKIL